MRSLGLGLDLPGFDRKLALLLFADDVVLLADSAEELQQLIDALHRLCSVWHLSINVEKTKVLVFGMKSESARVLFSFSVNGTDIEVAESFRYLGVVLQPDLRWNGMKSHLLTKASNAGQALMSVGSVKRYLSPVAGLNMYQALVRSRTEYGVQVWSVPNLQWYEADQLQVWFLRSWFGLPWNAPPMALLMELRLWPLTWRRKFLRLGFLWSLLHASPELLHAHMFRWLLQRWQVDEARSGWLADTVVLLEELELDFVLTNGAAPLQVMSKAHWRTLCVKAVAAAFHRSWQDHLASRAYLARFAALVPLHCFRLPLYLRAASRLKDVIAVMRFRLCCSPLLCDSGRTLGLPLEARFCRGCCDGSLETLQHVCFLPALLIVSGLPCARMPR